MFLEVIRALPTTLFVVMHAFSPLLHSSYTTYLQPPHIALYLLLKRLLGLFLFPLSPHARPPLSLSVTHVIPLSFKITTFNALHHSSEPLTHLLLRYLTPLHAVLRSSELLAH